MKKLLIVLSIVAVSQSCKNDINVLAPYKETTVVYGLLSASDSVQYIKINRAFLGEGNALVMAQNPDSINYPDVLDVSLERWFNGSKTQVISLIRDSSIVMESGTFANMPNILYRTPAHDSIYQNSVYKLIILNKQTNKYVTSETPVVDKISVKAPQAGASPVTFGSVNPYTVIYTPNGEGKIYNLTINFTYEENESGNPTGAVSHTVSWVFPNKEVDPGNNDEIQVALYGTEFFSFVKSKIQVNSALERHFVRLDFIFTVGGYELGTYYDVNQPSRGIVQEIPEYTNIVGGIGIFSSRFTQIIGNKTLDTKSIDSLRNGQYTKDLGFLN